MLHLLALHIPLPLYSQSTITLVSLSSFLPFPFFSLIFLLLGNIYFSSCLSVSQESRQSSQPPYDLWWFPSLTLPSRSLFCQSEGCCCLQDSEAFCFLLSACSVSEQIFLWADSYLSFLFMLLFGSSQTEKVGLFTGRKDHFQSEYFIKYVLLENQTTSQVGPRSLWLLNSLLLPVSGFILSWGGVILCLIYTFSPSWVGI